MKVLRTLLPLMTAIALTACGSDDDEPGSGNNPSPTPQPNTPVANVNKNNASLVTLLGQLEFPKVKEDGKNSVVSHQTTNYGVTYSLEWDHSLKAQRWTCYNLNRTNYASNGNTRKGLWPDGDPWNYDPTVPAEEQQATYNELSKSYYPGTKDAYFEKGHICPSADRLLAKDPNEQTYYMTNIMPMVSKFNGGIWQMMENKVRGWLGDPQKRTWSNYCDTLFICKGGTIDKADQILGYTVDAANVNGEDVPHPGHHIIPRYYFMALLAKKGDTYKALGFWVEHLNEDRSNDLLGNYVVSIDKLEELTGIDFFCNLPDDIENAVESASVDAIKTDWGLR